MRRDLWKNAALQDMGLAVFAGLVDEMQAAVAAGLTALLAVAFSFTYATMDEIG